MFMYTWTHEETLSKQICARAHVGLCGIVLSTRNSKWKVVGLGPLSMLLLFLRGYATFDCAK